jgi:hypothetical protein
MKFVSWLGAQWRRSDWLAYLLTALVTAILTVTSLELWSANPNVPLTYWGDALAIADHFKTTMETGWFTYQPLLGAPFGQTYNDFPTAENLNFMFAALLGFVTHNYVFAMNFYFFIGFIAEALTALWLLRKLNVSRSVSIALAVLFALAPYHYIRGESQLFLASYFLVPLSIWIVVAVLRGFPLWTRPEKGARWYAWFKSPFFGTLIILLLTATADTYYCVFFFILLVFAGFARLIRTGNWKRFWGFVVASAITLVATLVNSLPSIFYALVNGQDTAALDRGHADTEIYALKLSQLILPWAGSRIPILAKLRALYDKDYPLPSEMPALGAVAALGFIAALLIVAYIVSTGGRLRRMSDPTAERFGLLTQLASLVLVAFLFATVGGLSTIISFVTSDLRGWNRMAIYISMLGLAIVGLLLDALIGWIRRKAHARVTLQAVIAAAVAVVVLVVGYIDQTPANYSASYPSTIAAFNADATWLKRIDAVMPAGAEVLQLPYLPFPEGQSPNGVLSSDALIPFLHTTDIRWSAGGIKGRPRADWPASIEEYSPAQIAELAAAANFSGIYIDRQAMTTLQSRTLESGLEKYLGTKPMVSASKRYTFFDIRPLLKSLKSAHSAADLHRVEQAVVNPVEIAASGDFTMTQGASGEMVAQAKTPTATLDFTNARGVSISATLSMTIMLQQPVPSDAVVRIALPGGSTKSVTVHNGRATVSIPLVVTPGDTTATISSTSAPGAKPALVVLQQLMLTESTISKFLAAETATAQ